MPLAGIRIQTEHRPGHLVLWPFQFSLERDCAVQYWRTRGPKFLAGYPGSYSQQRHGVHKWAQGAGMEAADVFLMLDSSLWVPCSARSEPCYTLNAAPEPLRQGQAAGL